jgi:2-phosphosulfolactate phosphatase
LTPRSLTAEARIARDAFRTADPDLATLIRLSLSGQELHSSGFGEDVEIAVALNQSLGAPVLIDGAFAAMDASGATRRTALSSD